MQSRLDASDTKHTSMKRSRSSSSLSLNEKYFQDGFGKNPFHHDEKSRFISNYATTSHLSTAPSTLQRNFQENRNFPSSTRVKNPSYDDDLSLSPHDHEDKKINFSNFINERSRFDEQILASLLDKNDGDDRKNDANRSIAPSQSAGFLVKKNINEENFQTQARNVSRDEDWGDSFNTTSKKSPFLVIRSNNNRDPYVVSSASSSTQISLYKPSAYRQTAPPQHRTPQRPTHEYQISPSRVSVAARMDSKHSIGRPNEDNLQRHSSAVLTPPTPVGMHPDTPSISSSSKTSEVRDYTNYSNSFTSEDIRRRPNANHSFDHHQTEPKTASRTRYLPQQKIQPPYIDESNYRQYQYATAKATRTNPSQYINEPSPMNSTRYPYDQYTYRQPTKQVHHPYWSHDKSHLYASKDEQYSSSPDCDRHSSTHAHAQSWGQYHRYEGNDYRNYSRHFVKANDNDVLCGRGGGTNSHIGNKKFRALVKKHQQMYLKAKKKDKPSVAGIVVNIIRKRDPPGRFLKKDKFGAWCDIGDERAKEKTSQALREGAPAIRESGVLRACAFSLSSHDGSDCDQTRGRDTNGTNEEHSNNSSRTNSPIPLEAKTKASLDNATYSQKSIIMQEQENEKILPDFLPPHNPPQKTITKADKQQENIQSIDLILKK